MPPASGFTTKPVQQLFQEEIRHLGGTVRDSFDDGRRLFIRAVISNFRPVAFNDGIQAGVALRADEEQICVHPYIFRLVCKNGAIWAHALESVRLEHPASAPEPVLAAELGAAIRSCAAPAAFEKAVAEMRSARSRTADMALQLSALFSRTGSDHAASVLDVILDRFDRSGDRSRFGLMNAITSAGRDADDPELRWQLEALGAGIPAGVVPPTLISGNAVSLHQAYFAEMAGRPVDLGSAMSEPLDLAVAGR